MPHSLSINFGQPIPLFPLPSCVLLPHATIPLHIFEQRYRAMTRDAIAAEQLIAIAAFAGDDWRDDYEGTPPLRSHVCVGYIVKHDELYDGRFNILLQGVCRARIVEELPVNHCFNELDEPIEAGGYRSAMLEPTETQKTMEIDIDEQRKRIEALLSDDLLNQLASVSAIRNWASGEIPTHVLIDLSIMTICDDIEKRYQMLEECCVFNRAEWLEKMLTTTRKTLEIANRMEPNVTDDGCGLN